MGLIAVISGILLIFSSALLYYNFKTSEKELRESLDALVERSNVSLSSALWKYNHDYINDYIESLFLAEDVVFAMVEGGDTIIKEKAAGEFVNRGLDFFRSSQVFIVKERVVTYNGYDVGNVVIVMSRSRITGRVLRGSMALIFLLFLVMIAISLTTFLLSKMYLFEPLKRLERSVGVVAGGNFDIEITSARNDEIGHLAESFEKMVRTLKATTASRDELDREIKERIRAERELLMKSEAIENSLNGFDIVNEEGKLVYVNRAYLEMWGYDDPDEVIGTSPESHCVDPSMPAAIMSELKEKGESIFEFTAKRRDDSTFEVLMYVRKAYDPSGSEIYPSTSIDITDRKKAEEERKNYESSLRQAHKMEAIGTLAGGIAHDFNNILGIIIGNTELAMEEVPEWNAARENLEEVKTAGLRARDVVRQLLNFSRKAERKIAPVEILPIVRESVRLIRASIPATVHIRLELPDGTAAVMGDATQIHQVLINLCTNASHAMEEKGGLLTISLDDVRFPDETAFSHQTAGPGDYVRLRISDTGPGIDPDIMDKVLDPYFTTKDVGKGTGMGLAVVHGIVKNHDGIIEIESKAGEGTRVEVLFPATEDKPAAETESLPAARSAGEEILFVDDEPAVVNMAGSTLERLGYRVETETDAAAALELFRGAPGRFDLVVTDMTMPGMTGDLFIRELLRLRPGIPVVICTGFSERMDPDRAREIGAARYIEKPLVKGELGRVVREALDAALKKGSAAALDA